MVRRVLLLAGIAACTLAAQPLWPGSRYTEADRAQAIRRGLQFIYSTAQPQANFAQNSEDYLFCFYSLSEAGADPGFRAESRRLGVELAHRWRAMYPHIPADAGASATYYYASGSNIADLLGVPDQAMDREAARAVKRFRVADYFRFDPKKEPVPVDLPEICSRCRYRNARGASVCKRCGEKLVMKNPYDVLFDALVGAYFGDLAHIDLGAHLADVTQWIPRLRPYRLTGQLDDNFYDVAYVITHIVYTLNDYSRYRLKPEWLPEEYDFLKGHFDEVFRSDDGETLGEFLDSLKAFGLTESDPLIQRGEDYLLSHQNADGSWGDPSDKDIYTRYHSTWTGIGGVMSYAWKGERASSPEALRRIQRGR